MLEANEEANVRITHKNHLSFVALTLAVALLLHSQAPAPAGFSVTSATKSSVVLSWQPVTGVSGYVLQRRAMGEGSYYAVNNVYLASGATYTDTSFDPFTAYAYRIYVMVGNTAGVVSNEVIAGPPPNGFSSVAPTPASAITAKTGQWYGQLVSMALDANGDPAIAFQDSSAATSSNNQLTYINFSAWDRAHYQFKSPVRIDSVHSQSPAKPEIALAFDSSTNRFGVAYVSENDNAVRVSFSSDGGQTWGTPLVTQTQGSTLGMGGVAFKMANGQFYLMYSLDPGGSWLVSDPQTEKAFSGKAQNTAPLSNDWSNVFDVAVDSSGQPAVAYAYHDNNTGSDIVNFWRPTSPPTTTRVTTSNGFNNMIGAPDLRLVFDGKNPRIFTYLQRSSTAGTSLWLLSSNDGGSTWGAPMQMPSDGDAGLQALITLAVGPQGQITTSASSNGGTASTMKCGFPKLSRSSDLTNWTTCGPGNGVAPMNLNYYPSAAYASNGKLYLAFQVPNSSNNMDLAFPGVWLWREAPQPGNLLPVLNAGGVINNASHSPSVSPGMIAEIYGVNLGQLSLANTVPLPIPLGLGLSPTVTTTVTINGIPAPIFFTSANQVDVQIPFEVTPGTTVPFTVTVNDTLSAAVMVKIVAFSPGIYAVINANGTYNPANGAAKPGDWLTVYMTGLGAVSNTPADGAVALPSPLSMVQGAVTATIGGQNAAWNFAGLTPGNVGLYQVNLQVPALAPGNYPLIISEGGNASNAITISVVAP
jgi:uncharacterized protein (TIGR03437 family)